MKPKFTNYSTYCVIKEITSKVLPFILYSFLMLLTFSNYAFSQKRSDDTAACAACGIFSGVLIIIPILLLVLNIALLVWVAKDSKSRGMDNSVMWMILVFIVGPIGLIIYIFSRPKGNLVQCSSCNNKRLEASAKCPHCGNV